MSNFLSSKNESLVNIDWALGQVKICKLKFITNNRLKFPTTHEHFDHIIGNLLFFLIIVFNFYLVYKKSKLNWFFMVLRKKSKLKSIFFPK